MCRHPLLRSWLLLVPLLVAACGWPDAAAPPTAATATPATIAAAPATAALVAASPTVAVPATAAPPTVTTSILPQAQLDPTQETDCQQPGDAVMPECMARVAALPPTPAVPFDQALRQFTGRALLYTRLPSFLMIGDPESGASLWLNGAFCPPRRTRDVYGEWSADGRFVAFICQDNRSRATIHLLDMQTAAGRQIAQGDAVDFAWSPTGHGLLVAEQTNVQRAVILDAVTGATTALPVAPLWENQGSPAPNVDQAVPNGGWFSENNNAAMTWSPDGARIAVIADQMYVLDADAAHTRDGKLAVLTTIGGSSIRRPQWSHDGRFLFTIEPHQNHTNALAPSSMWGAVGLRTEISTGVVTDTYPAEPLWSPDEKAYLAWVPAAAGGGNWTLYQADGTLTRVLTDELTYGPFWTPDSQQILLQPYRGQINQLVAIDLAGHEHTILATHNNVGFWRQHGSPTSPDGELLAFTVELSNVAIDERGRVVVYDFQGRQRAMFEGWG